eukprot:Em0013g582a
MALAHIGKAEEFDSATDDWTSYLERDYMKANKISNDARKDAFLACIGKQTYALLRALIAPAKPGEKTYKELVAALTKHLAPKPLLIAERYRFHKRDQKEGETVREYVACLQKMTEHCSFGPSLADTLRDRLVTGMRNEMVQRRLLTEVNLTLARAIEIAETAEKAEKDAAEIHPNAKNQEVHRVPHAGNDEASRPRCYRCGGRSHRPQDCRFMKEQCRFCRKQGHIERVCKAKEREVEKLRQRGGRRRVDMVDMEKHGEQGEKTEENFPLYWGEGVGGQGQWKSGKPVLVKVFIEGIPLNMELDTGAAVSLLPFSVYQAKFQHLPLRTTKTGLKTYTGEQVTPKGQIVVNVTKESQTVTLPLIVVDGNGPPLLGRNWLASIPINWQEIKMVTSSKSHSDWLQRLNRMMEKYPNLWKEGLEPAKGIKASLNMKENVTPVYWKARSIPYSMRARVEVELEKLQKDGVISPVTWSEWATPLVVVPKEDGRVRLCGDFKVSLNPALKVDHYPLPKVEDIFATLGKSKVFSKVDLKLAYLQLELEEETKKLVTVNTHKGLFQYNRLPFGIASAPAIWQRTMDTILHGIAKVQCLLDDIIVAGETEEEHLTLLEEVLQRLNSYNLTVNKQKCKFFQKGVEFCGHYIDEHGLHRTQDKIKAVLEAPRPVNTSQLRSLLGMVNYYHRFLPGLATTLGPLHQLLQEGIKWQWAKDQEAAFRRIKEMMASETVLTHFNPELPLMVACDASAYGLGAVLSHRMQDGTERPVAFASRTLTAAEKNYAQIDKEALALIWGIKKFHHYLYGHHFTLITDHQPLTSILNPKKGLPATTTARLQRYALFLAGYEFEICYRNTRQHANADALSRLPWETGNEARNEEGASFLIMQMEQLPITTAQLREATGRDQVLSKVLRCCNQGWTTKGEELKEKNMTPYWHRQTELSTEQGCLLWGTRMVIPTKLRKQVLEELHEGHLGVVKMKSLARSTVWWPGLDTEIENITRACRGCQEAKQDPKLTPLHPWELPEGPWKRIHIDFAGPVEGKMLLVAIDAYSKWPEVVVMGDTSAESTVEEVRALFARWGIPSQVVTDNGPQFTSQCFERFVRMNHVKHTKTSPYHPATNGLAERFVQSLKQAIKAARGEDKTLRHRIANFLISYRNATHATTEESPAHLMIKRDLRSRLHLLVPSIQDTVQKNQARQVAARAVPERNFEEGDTVMVRDYRASAQARWIQGKIKTKYGRKTYLVEMKNGGVWKRHADQIRKDGSQRQEQEQEKVKGRGSLNNPTGEPGQSEEQSRGDQGQGAGIKDNQGSTEEPSKFQESIDSPFHSGKETEMENIEISEKGETGKVQPQRVNPEEESVSSNKKTRLGRTIKKPLRYGEN